VARSLVPAFKKNHGTSRAKKQGGKGGNVAQKKHGKKRRGLTFGRRDKQRKDVDDIQNWRKNRSTLRFAPPVLKGTKGSRVERAGEGRERRQKR